jgi:rubrerythrin
VRKFIKKAIEIEKLMARTYQEFLQSEHNDEILAVIWSDLAKDEEEHAMQLEFATRLPLHDAFSGIADACPDPDQLYAFVSEIYHKARHGNPGKLEMLTAAVELENRLQGIHATHALIFKETSLLKTFERLANSEEKHVAGLENYLKRNAFQFS